MHVSNVSAEEWAAELDRVLPQLRMNVDLSRNRSDWSQAIATVKQLKDQIEAADLISSIAGASCACCAQWKEELAKLRRHEESLNSMFAEQVSDISRLRSSSVEES